MKNHNVCIIGNDPSLLESSKGKLIDSFDTIVRFNRSPIKGYEEHVGTKTTHRFVNRIVSKNAKEDNAEDSKFIPSLRNQIIILDKDNKVVSNPGGTAPEYRNGELQLMVQSQPIFKHCHDVCIDQDENIYVCQWNAGKTYPIKLERV